MDFKSRFSVFQVCPYCTSMLVRTDMNVEMVGKMAQLAADMSPFQLGTTGRFEKRHFEILGKQKLVYSEGNWNEWYLMFDDGREGWLGEAQGFLMVSFPVKNFMIPDLGTLSAGSMIEIHKESYHVEDIKSVTCEGGVGELPVPGVKGRRSTSVDLVGPAKSFANIDYAGHGDRLYLGRYAEFEELQFSNLRELDGW